MKYFLYLLLFLAPLVSAQKAKQKNVVPNNFTLEVRGGYFYPQSPTLRDIYKGGGGEFEIELSTKLPLGLSIWGNFNFFQRDSHYIFGEGDASNIRLFPLSFGLKETIHFFQNLAVYIGIGPSFTLVRIKEESLFTKEKYHNDNWGFVTKAGLMFYLNEACFIDVFTDYYFTNANVLGTKHNVGGLRVGAGLGVCY